MTAQVFFSDFFGISPEVIKKHGAVDISLVNDIPLFIDPFLLFNSDKPKYQQLHQDIIEYLVFLRDKAVAGPIEHGLLKELYCFPEVRQLWLGFCLAGNQGSGLGIGFAEKLHRNLQTIFDDFGKERLTQGSHLEKLCLIESGVGKDNISDFSANLTKGFLVEYTQEFAERCLRSDCMATHTVEKVRFNYETESWVDSHYVLPTFEEDYVLLAPRDILTKDDTWINRSDLIDQFDAVRESIDNDALRGKINNYFLKRLSATTLTASERREAVSSTIHSFPELVEYFIRFKEEQGDKAVAVSSERVRFAEQRFIHNVRELSSLLAHYSEFYEVLGDTRREARMRAEYLKDVIEKKGGWRFFYVDDEPVGTEAHLHILFRLTWLGTPSDVSHEVNDGRGPADFKVSRGAMDKTIIEFKLAANRKLKQNLQHQVEAYKSASDAAHGLKVILYFNEAEYRRVLRILKNLQLTDSNDIMLIDGRSDNKPSASNVTS